MRKKALSALPVMGTKKKGRLVGVRIDGDTLVLDCWNGGKYQGRYCIRENGEYMSYVNGVWQQQKLCDVLSGVRYRGYYSYAENGKAFDEAQQKMAEQFFDKIKSGGYSIESSANYAESDFMAEKRRRREQRRIERINKRMDEVPVLPDGFEGWVKAVPFEGIHLEIQFAFALALDNAGDGKAVFVSEHEIAFVVRGNAHNRARAVGC